MSATRLVTILVGLALLTCTGGIIALAFQGIPIPDVLQNVAVGSLTGLVGLLAPTQQPRPSA